MADELADDGPAAELLVTAVERHSVGIPLRPTGPPIGQPAVEPSAQRWPRTGVTSASAYRIGAECPALAGRESLCRDGAARFGWKTPSVTARSRRG
jgi:hypothetical protein